MAATLQPQQQANPQLKRLVYSKYREMLGSYNDKANTIIQSLPSYMVTEDRGFQFEEKDDCDKVGYGGQRLQANPGVEPPVCVQNAMMTKDKKPFTYTPGGIDLSEIKSPRMAKRIARNAQHEGVSGQPKPSPLAQQNATQQSPPIAPQPPSALGMPVQVFPTGPPPPPPQSSQNKAAPPPPPPQPSANQLKPQSNGIDTRRSPTPQNFEPPPMGCRPEIKIPPNPMATLRKVPKPKEKNDFWIDEYRRDRSSSPMIASNDQVDEAQNHQNYSTKPQDHVYTPAPIQPSFRSVSPPKQQYRPPSPLQPQYQEPPRVQPQLAFPIQQGLQTRVEPPYASPSSPIQSVPSPPRSNHPPSNRWGPPPQPQQQQQQQQTKNVQVGSLYIPPVAPENLATTKQQDQQQRSAAVTNSPTPKWMAQRPNMKEVPEWVRDEEDSARSSPPQRTQQVMHSPPHTVSPPTTAPFMSFQIATTAPNAKERVIPIQMEQPGTPVKTPGTPNYGPQPFYNTNQQFSSVPSPNSAGSGHANSSSGYNSPTHVIRNPNQFVDQGYNNYQWPAQNRVKSPPVQQHPTATETTGVTRIIPIAIEGQDNSFPPNVVRGPISQSPMVIQNDPRTLQHQNSWGASTPNQSKSFRILQKITDTEANQDSELDSSSQIQRPLYSRQLGGTPSVDSSIDQMKRMQLNEQDRDFMNRVKTSVPMQRPQPPRYVQQKSIIQQGENIQPYIHPSEQQVPEPKKYMGSAIPSRSFKILQAMTTPENAGPGQSDL